MLIRQNEEEPKEPDLSDEQKIMIEFLINLKLAADISAVARTWTAVDYDDVAHLLDDRNKLFARYSALSEEGLDKLYQRERSIFESERDRIFRALDDYAVKFWATQDAWAVDEAVSLSLGYLPNVSMLKWAKKHEWDDSAKSILTQENMVRRAIAAQKLREPIRPSDFCLWADTKTFPLPPSLADEVMGIGESQASLRDKLSSALSKVRELEIEVKQLQAEREHSGKPSYARLLNLFGIAAIAHYQFNPEAEKNPAAAKIVHIASLRGIEISEPTVLGYIRQGLDIKVKKRARAKQKKR